MTELIPVSEAIGRTIALLGASRIFGVVGSGNFRVTNAMVAQGVPFVAARHEMGAACMADAFSRSTGRVSVVSVHQGCGLTNALTGIGEAAKCHTPVLVVAGDTADGDVTSNFYIDQDAAVTAVGAIAARVTSAESAVAETVHAFALAVQARKTVVLSLPVDVQEELTTWDAAAVRLPDAAPRQSADPDDVASVVAALRSSERPVIVAGRGSAEAAEHIRLLGTAIGAILVTSAGGRGLFVGDEWALDIMGGFATDGAAELIAEADIVIAIGASLNNWTTRSGALVKDKLVVHVDDRPEAIGFHCAAQIGVVADAAMFSSALTEAVRADGPARRRYRTSETAARIARSRYWVDQAFESRIDDHRIDPQAMTNLLDDLLPIERVVVPDGGNFTCYPSAHLRVPDRAGYCLPLSFQSIGLGLASAIGAALASPERVTVAAIGDGGFLMSLVELDTAVRLGLGMLVVVYNDSAYGAEVHVFDHPDDDLATVTFPETDIAAIARGFKCEGVTVRNKDDLAGVRDWLARGRPGPLVVDVKVIKFASWILAHSHDVEVRAAVVTR